MKLAVQNCTVYFTISGKNITYIEIQEPGKKPWKASLRTNGTTGNTKVL